MGANIDENRAALDRFLVYSGQHAALKAQIEEQLDSWQRLLARLDDRRFPRGGELFQRALAALRAVHSVWEFVEFHRP
jgi:hypothetical protein